MGQIQALFGYSNQHVSADCYPNLRLHRVLAGAVEHFDSQMLLDPLEEQFHLPALAIQVGNQCGLQNEVVRQKNDAFACFVLDNDTAQQCRIVLAGVEQRQYTRLIAHDIRRDLVHRVGIASLELGIALGASDKERVGLMNHKQALEIQITAIEQIERARLDGQLVQGVDLVGLTVGNMDESGYIASQIQQSVQPHRRLGLSERRPRKNRQTQIDGGCVERVNGRIQIDSQRLAGVQRTGNANQVLRQIGIDLPRTRRVCVGQRVARDCLATKPHVVQPLGLGAQIDLDVAQRLSISQLGECHRKELIQTREVVNFVIAPMFGYAAAKGAQGQVCHELRKHEFALMHMEKLRLCAKTPQSDIRCSNRDQTTMLISANKSLTYEVLM